MIQEAACAGLQRLGEAALANGKQLQGLAKPLSRVIPAKAAIQTGILNTLLLDPRMREDDGWDRCDMPSSQLFHWPAIKAHLPGQPNRDLLIR